MRLVAAKYGTGEFSPFDSMDMFDEYTMAKDETTLKDGDCLVVWGGADISPSLYGKDVGHRTGADKTPSFRDNYEWRLMHKALELDIPIIGICRGAQMLCALSGGTLIQDVSKHGSDHEITTCNGDSFTVNSLHHQMMYPFKVDHDLLAWASPNRSEYYLDVNTPIEVEIEPEAVYFQRVKGLAIQWHPEFMDIDTAATKYIKELLKGYV